MNKEDNHDIVNSLLEHHRFYINRIWQFFGGILLINSIILSSIDKFLEDNEYVIGVTGSAILLIAIFYHLINWTNMRVDKNMENINRLSNKVNITAPNSIFAGLINWMKFGIIILATPHFIFCYRANTFVFIVSIVVFFVMLFISENVVRSFKKFDKSKQE